MTVIYSQDFESTSVGAPPTGWAAPDSSSWAVQSSVVVSGTKALRCSSSDGSLIMYAPTGTELPLADMEVRADIKPGTAGNFLGLIVRGSADGSRGYLVIPWDPTNLNNSFRIYYKDVANGITSWTQINNSATSGLTNGAAISLRVNITGAVISFKVWNQGSTEPSGWTGVTSDSHISAPGYIGFYNQGATPDAVADNIAIDDLAAAASDFSLTGPTPASVALSDGGQGGTFTPSSLTISDGGNHTFTYTPLSSATTSPVTISATATGGLTGTKTAQITLAIPATNFSLTAPTPNTTTPLTARDLGDTA